MADVYLVQDINILIDANDSALTGVDNLILEGNSVTASGDFDLDELYLTSGPYPFMLIMGTTGTELDNVTDGYSDGTVYGFFGLIGIENELTLLSSEDFPYDNTIDLELNSGSFEG